MQPEINHLRNRILTVAAWTAGCFGFALPAHAEIALPIQPDFQSPFLAVGFARTAPRFAYFSVDALGRGQLARNPVLRQEPLATSLTFSALKANEFAYRVSTGAAGWTITCGEKKLKLQSRFVANHGALPAFELVFDQKANHATLLGLMRSGERRVALPAVLHLPDFGSVRIRSNVPEAGLDYEARRFLYTTRKPPRFVQVSFPPATAAHPLIEYELEVAAIHPPLANIENDPLFDGFRRNFLNVFQVNPRIQMLANNASSDPCAFTLFIYAELARKAPPLIDKVTPLDLIRMTLDRYISGAKGYGLSNYKPSPEAPDLSRWIAPWHSLDSLPSLVISASYYAQGARDWDWARANYPALAAWGREIFASDKDGNGLIEYPQSGNYETSEVSPRQHRPANWWDNIMFGHEDAYANALAYRAATAFAEVAVQLGQTEDAAWFSHRAAKLRQSYVPTFFNPATGVLAGWKSADGQLNDYWFTFVSAVAITYDLVGEKDAHAIMDKLLRKMTDVGFTAFQYGLPGNLVPIRKGHYFKHAPGPGRRRSGEPELEDGSDGFQIYENGGATGCFAYFTYKALYQLGRVEDARRLFHPALRTFAAGGFQGFDASGQSVDWRDWSGRGHGYEGFLVDNYLALLAGCDEWAARQP